MAILPINIYGDEVLRKKAEPVAEITPALVRLAHDMLDTMYDAPGIGLAAPQIGKSICLVVIDITREEDEQRDPMILFNPEIAPEEGENPVVPYEEGCLSVPDIFCDVMRAERIRIRYQNEHGEWVEKRNVDGLLSRCMQHEVDHLNGVLFVDKISTSDRTLTQSKLRKMAKSRKG
jgi:peptide deformylase